MFTPHELRYAMPGGRCQATCLTLGENDAGPVELSTGANDASCGPLQLLGGLLLIGGGALHQDRWVP